MTRLNELFAVTYGNKFDLNKLTRLSRSKGGVSLVGRSQSNHGVSATVAPVKGVKPYPSGLITVALGGTKLLSSFVQEFPFYTAQNVAVLRPLEPMTFAQKVFMCVCIRANRFRYGAFGREANRTLKILEVPALADFPPWVASDGGAASAEFSASAIDAPVPSLNATIWHEFVLGALFSIERGRGPRRKDLVNGQGATPFITSSDRLNGLSGHTLDLPRHSGNVITVNRNGSVAEAFYQPKPFCSTEDVHVFIPKFELTPEIALFLTTIIRREKYRYSYGRKWGLERMTKSVIKLPALPSSKSPSKPEPDWAFMERYIKACPFSSQVS